MRTVPDLLILILAKLQSAIAHRAWHDRARAPVFRDLANYLARTTDRFARLYALWRAGTLPTPRPARARPARSVNEGASTGQAAPKPRLPAARAWLLRLVQPAAATVNSQLRALIDQPDCAEFLRAVPQAARLLRPILRMVSPHPLPPLIALPPRPPRIRPPRIRPPRPPREPAPDRTPSPSRLRQIIGRLRLPPILFPLRKNQPA